MQSAQMPLLWWIRDLKYFILFKYNIIVSWADKNTKNRCCDVTVIVNNRDDSTCNRNRNRVVSDRAVIMIVITRSRINRNWLHWYNNRPMSGGHDIQISVECRKFWLEQWFVNFFIADPSKLYGPSRVPQNFWSRWLKLGFHFVAQSRFRLSNI